jgi:ABC transporter substrate binding protein
VRCRRFLALLGGTAIAWPGGATAQSRARLGYLSGGRKDDNAENTIEVFRGRLSQLGWRAGDTLEIDERWAAGDSALAVRHRLPAIYENRTQIVAGGLMSYGGDLRENDRQGAGYVHRILTGTRPGERPVVQASRFELVLNLKTARALGLAIPPGLLARADEVIE